MDDTAQRLKKLEDFAFGRRRAGVELTDDSGGLGVGRQFALDDHYHAHGNRGGGKLHAVATVAANGFMSSAQVATLAELVAEVAALTPVSHPALTLGAFSSTPTAQGLALDVPTQVLQMTAADGTRPGGLSTTTQTIGGAKTFSALITASLGVTSGAATLPLYSTLGTGASDVLLKLGSSVADGSVNASAKLVSIRTGIGGTEVEYAYFSKNFLGIGNGPNSNGGKNLLMAVGGTGIWEFSKGASSVTPTFDIRNTAGKACGLLTGTVGSAFFYDSTGPFFLLSEVRANIDSGNAGTGTIRASINGAIFAAVTIQCGTAYAGTPTGALQSSGEYENLVNGGGTILLSPGGTRYRTQNTDPGGITVTNIATATVTTSVIGTNTGDITLAAFGTTPNANGATLTGQVLNLEPASISRPGGVSTVAQVFSGVKTMHVEGNNTTLATLSSNEFQIESSKGTPNVPVLKLISLTTPVAQFYSSTTGAAVLESLLTTTLKVAGQDSLYADGTGLVQVLPGSGTPSLNLGAAGSPRAYVSFDMAALGTMTAASDGYVDFVSNSLATSFGRFRWLFSGSAAMTLSDNMWLAPSSAAGLTLGTSALPWGQAWFLVTGNNTTLGTASTNQVTIRNDTASPYTWLKFNSAGTDVAGIACGPSAELVLSAASVVYSQVASTTYFRVSQGAGRFSSKPVYDVGSFSATGTTQAGGFVPSVTDAFAGYQVTTAAGALAVTLPSAALVGTCIFLLNVSATAMSLFPHSGGNINALAANTAISVTTSRTAQCVRMGSNTWAVYLTA